MTKKENLVLDFAYFAANFPHDFIEKCWKNSSMKHHLKSKLKSSNDRFISTGDFMNFFFNLDQSNQIQLINWIDENYNH